MIASAAVLVLALLPSLADADRVRFEIRRTAFATGCPGDEELADRVRQRLGSEPFTEDPSARWLRVRLDGEEGRLRARVILVGADGETRGRRELLGDPDCSALADQLVLALAIAIDPLLLVRPPPAALAPPPIPVKPPEPTGGLYLRRRGDLQYGTSDSIVNAPPLEGVVPRGSVARILVTATALVAAVPAPSLRTEISLDFRWWQLDGGVRFDIPVRYPVGLDDGRPDGQLDLTLLAVDLAPCIPERVAPRLALRICAVGQAGLLTANGVNFSRNVAVSHPWFALGPRTALAWRVWPRAGLLVTGDVLVPLVRPKYVNLDDPSRVYHQPGPLTGSLGIGLEIEAR